MFVATKLFHKAGEGSGGGGGGDQHNLGWYATQSALETAHPTANNGDWAIVGSTDTVWVWDTDTSAWVDSDQKGQVTSVNNQTGAVTLTASDVGALPDDTHIPADPVQADWDEADSAALDYIKNKPTIPAAQVNSDWNANSGVAQILNKPTIPDAIQTGTMPTASADELGKVYQFIGTTDANYTHGYFYECVSDGQNPATYSWSNVQVQASSGGLPSQTGQSGKFLTTDGTDASWSDKPLVNNTTGTTNIAVGDTATASKYNNIVIGNNASSGSNTYGSVVIGLEAQSNGNYGVILGRNTKNTSTGVGIVNIGTTSTQSANNILIGRMSDNQPAGCIFLNSTNTVPATGVVDAGEFGVTLTNGTYKILSSDGTIPSDRLAHAINKYSTMPTASRLNVGWIVQFTGTTDSTYTHGHLYECVSDGADPATYSWTEVQLGGGGSSYTAGTGIDITSGVISVTGPTLQNRATGANAMAVGIDSTTKATGSMAVSYGYYARASGGKAVALGGDAEARGQRSVQLGGGINSDDNTFKVGNLNGNFEMMSADGTIPTARLTKVNTTITLAAADWSSNTQTVNVTGMTATGVVMVSPAPTDQSLYTAAGVLCTAQAAGTLTFTCSTTPSADLSVNVVML